MFDPCVLLIGVLFRVLVSDIRIDFCRNLLSDNRSNPIFVSPLDVPEEIVECLQDVGEPVEIRFWLVPPGLPSGKG